MPTPALIASTRFCDQAVTRIYYLPVIAAATRIPTRVEMNAGTNLTGEVNDLSGWVIESEVFDTQPMGSAFKTEGVGSLSASNCSLTLYTSKNGIDVRSLLPRGATGFIMFCDGGDSLANKAEVFPVKVAATGVLRTTGGDASKVRVVFAVTAAPAQGVPIPA